MAGESTQVMKNITRVIHDKKRVDGYYVRLQWKKQSYSKLFQIEEFGEEGALQDAIEWRNMKEQEIGKPRTEKIILGIQPPIRKTNTGEKGIRRAMIRHHQNGKPVGREHDFFIITAFDSDGQIHRTGISIDKHGEKKAMKLARKRYQEMKKL